MAKIESTVIGGKRVKVGSKRHAELTGLSAYKDTSGNIRNTADTSFARGQNKFNVPTISSVPLKSEPAVLSSQTGRDTFQSEILPSIDNANASVEAATQVREDNKKQQEQDKRNKQEDFLLSDTSTLSPEDLAYQAQIDLYQTQKSEITNAYREMAAAARRTANAKIKSLTKTYDRRFDTLQKSNNANLANWKQSFVRSGQAEYSPGMTGDFLSAKEQEGLQKLNQLDDEYNAAVDAINTALEEKQFSIAASKAEALRDIDNEINEIVSANLEEAKKVNQQMRIVDAYTSGITDAASIASITGVSLDTVGEALKTLVPDGLDDIVKTAVNNGATPDILRNIMSATSLSEAYNKAGAYGRGGSGILGEYNAYRAQAEAAGQIPMDFSSYQTMDANRKRPVVNVGASGIPNSVVTQIDKISSSFDSAPIVKEFNEVLNKKQSIDSIITSGVKGPADLALVFEFMKSLDPTSVVRESEYDTAAQSGNIFAGTYAKFNGYLSEGGGFLPEQVRKDFQTITNRKYEIKKNQYENLRREKGRLIEKKTSKYDPETPGTDYLIDYAGAANLIEDAISMEEQAQNRLDQVYLERGDEIDTIITQNPDLSASDILQVLGVQLQ